MSNINPETGIAYGVIATQHLDGDLAQELFYGPHAVDESYRAAYEEARMGAKLKYDSLIEEATIAAAETGADREGDFDPEDFQANWFEAHGHLIDQEEFVEAELERFSDCCQIDEPDISGTYEGVTYAISWLGGAPLLWVFQSEFTSMRSACSPCVPGAGDLDSDLNANGILCYDVPDDWRFKEIV